MDNYKIDSLELELFSTEDPIKTMEIQIELTEILVKTDIDRALQIALQTLDLATDQNNQNIKLLAWNQLARIYRLKDDYRSSMEIGNKAKNLAIELNQDIEYAKSLFTLARNFSSLGDYKKSADLNFQALKIFEEYNDTKGIGIVYSGIGTNHYHQGNYDKSLDYYSKALSISRNNKDLAGIARGLNNVAIVLGQLGEYESVIKNIKESIEINKILNNIEWVGINYLNLGSVFRLKQEFKSAYYYLNSADSIFSKQNNQTHICNIKLNLSSYYFDLNKLDSSLLYAQRAYKLGVDHDLKTLTHNSAEQLRNIYHLQSNINNAFKFSLIKEQLKDSLDTKNTTTRISQLELLHDFDRLEQEFILKQQRREFIFIAIGSAIVITLLVLVFIIMASYRIKTKNIQIERKRLNLELEMKNRELAANVMSLIRKNEVLSGIGEKLMDIQDKAVKVETKTAIKKIARDIQNASDNDVWDEFEVRFKKVHGEFYDKLIKQYPDLSPNEQKICAFLRLNMSTKEISDLTGQQANTIEIARWRLRKKLNITDRKTNLVTFLCEI